MDRELWKKPLSTTHVPGWPCPRCRQTSLRVLKDTLRHSESADSKREHQHEGWDPCWITYRFSAILQCSRKECGESLGVCGDGYVEQEYDWPEHASSYTETFAPRLIYPAPPMIRIPHKCPESVRKELDSAFALYWSDPSAAANRIRCSVEALLTAQRIVQRQRTKQASLRRLTLHDRIELFHKRRPELADALQAIRWLGNSGSHRGGMSKDDVLDGLEIIEYVLNELYESRSRRVAAIAKQINRRRGPRPAK